MTIQRATLVEETVQVVKLKFAVMVLSAIVGTASANFIGDEFDGASLGTQWSFTSGTTTVPNALGEVYPNTPAGHLSLIPALGTNYTFDVHTDTNISQDQPTDPTWDVRVKIDNWAPSDLSPTGQQVALRLYQNSNRWLGINVTRRYTSSSNTWQYVLQAQSLFTDLGTTVSPLIHKTEIPVFNFTMPESLYLRIQKTSKGYTMGYSADDVTYIDRGVFVRDPYTADGFMDPSAKIRVSAIAPLADNNQIAEAAELDWIRKLPFPVNNAPYADDEFEGTALDSRWLYNEGIYNVPGIPGGMTAADGKAKLTHSTGFELGIAYNTDRPQFIIQNAPTENTYSLITRVTPANLIPFANWEGHGLRLWQDQNHWIAIVNQRNSGNTTTGRNNVESRHEFDNGGTTANNNINIGVSTSDPGPEYLRIDKQGSKYRTRYSLDGGTTWLIGTSTTVDPEGWVDLGTELKNAQIQLVTKRPGSQRGATTSEFESIKVELPPAGVEDWQLF